ncbi:hypothetical protein E2C01_070099 [Portunus trituberculatus]|uniref:Uncharacterized protein n=1 Tax=Portunus trituberculatus TaxID=210409 RepID=A0A5B7I181_PORTR|nr:hypothetical protein [Portunus trituberculatus]
MAHESEVIFSFSYRCITACHSITTLYAASRAPLFPFSHVSYPHVLPASPHDAPLLTSPTPPLRLSLHDSSPRMPVS